MRINCIGWHGWSTVEYWMDDSVIGWESTVESIQYSTVELVMSMIPINCQYSVQDGGVIGWESTVEYWMDGCVIGWESTVEYWMDGCVSDENQL